MNWHEDWVWMIISPLSLIALCIVVNSIVLNRKNCTVIWSNDIVKKFKEFAAEADAEWTRPRQGNAVVTKIDIIGEARRIQRQRNIARGRGKTGALELRPRYQKTIYILGFHLSVRVSMANCFYCIPSCLLFVAKKGNCRETYITDIR